MFSSFPSADPPPPRANRIPPRMRASTGSLQLLLHRQRGLPGWNKLDGGRSLNSPTGSHPPASKQERLGGPGGQHAVDSFPGIFMSNAFPLRRRRDSFLCYDNGSKVARNPQSSQSISWKWVNFVKMSVSDDIMLLVFVGGLWAARGEGRNRRATVTRRH